MTETENHSEEDFLGQINPPPASGLPLDNEEPMVFASGNQPINFALYSTITEGIGISKWQRIVEFFADSNEINIENKYFREIKNSTLLFLNKAVQSCQQAFSLSKERKIVSFDGSWNCPKNAKFCIIDIFDVQTKKLIDFQIVTSYSFPDINHTHLTHSVKEKPQAFEAIGMKEICARKAFLDNTYKFVHDGDVKLKNYLVKQKGLPIEERLDPNHIAKSLFGPLIQQNHPLNGLYLALKNHWLHVLKTIKQEERASVFMEFYNFLISSERWALDYNEEKKEKLKNLIKDASEYYAVVEPGCHTNFNEAFHSLKALYAPKNGNWKLSWIHRMAAAILKWNHPNNYLIIIKNLCKIGKKEKIIETKYQRRANHDRERRSMPEYKSAIAQKKNIKAFQTKQKSNELDHAPSTMYHKPEYSPVLKEELVSGKHLFNKKQVWGYTEIILPTNWHEKVYYFKCLNQELFNNYVHNMINTGKTLIVRINPVTFSCIMIVKPIGSTSDHFCANERPQGSFTAMLNNQNFRDILQEIPLSLGNIENKEAIKESKEKLYTMFLKVKEKADENKKQPKRIRKTTKKKKNESGNIPENCSQLFCSGKSIEPSPKSSPKISHSQSISSKALNIKTIEQFIADPFTDPIALENDDGMNGLTIQHQFIPTLLDLSAADEEITQTITDEEEYSEYEEKEYSDDSFSSFIDELLPEDTEPNLVNVTYSSLFDSDLYENEICPTIFDLIEQPPFELISRERPPEPLLEHGLLLIENPSLKKAYFYLLKKLYEYE